MIPIDGSVEAVYEDGYVLSETEHNDVSPFTGKDNILNDILEHRPDKEHGRMIRFSCYYQNHRYDVDFTDLPDNARPVRWKRMEADTMGSEVTEVRLTKVGFGYQYTDELTGRNVQEVVEL